MLLARLRARSILFRRAAAADAQDSNQVHEEDEGGQSDWDERGDEHDVWVNAELGVDARCPDRVEQVELDETEEVEVKEVEEKEEPKEEPKKEESKKEVAAKKILKKMGDKGRYDSANQLKTLIVMQVLGNSKSFFDSQKQLNDIEGFFTDQFIPDAELTTNNIAQYFLFAGSDGLMNEMVMQQWQN